MSIGRPWPELRGRQHERTTLCQLLTAVQGGHSQVLVLRGEGGIGKTALLRFLVDRAASCRVAHAAGVESEMGLEYASLHQLCAPYVDRAGRLPAPQRNALGTAFGLRSGSSPDRFHLGLAVLRLLALVAEDEPLICVVDDAQWLDGASAQTLEFVARRLDAEPVAIVFAIRETEDPRFTGFPELAVRALGSGDATALLESAVPWALDPRVRDRVVAESHGNPLALLELPRGLTATELVFGSTGASDSTPLVNRLERRFVPQLRLLPWQARQLLLTAAAEPLGDVVLLWRAAEVLGLGTEAATAAEASGLIELGDRVRFRHPLVRSAVYHSATPAERRKVHRALAEVTDPDIDPDRRAWHRARAAVGTDEAVAASLAGAADRALAYGGLAAAAACLETAAALTHDRARRARRSIDAAQAKAAAGAYEEALSLMAAAQTGPLDVACQARIDLLRAQIADSSTDRAEAVPMLLAAARRFEPLDGQVARETYLDALSAAVSSGRLASGSASGVRQVARVAREVPRPEVPGKADLLLAGMAVLYTDGYAASAPLLHRAVQAFASEDLTMPEAFHSARAAAAVAADLWDDVHWDVVSQRHLDVARRVGALSLLPVVLTTRAIFEIHSGNLTAAASLIAERRWLAGVTGGEPRLTPLPEAWLAAMRGHDERAELLIKDTMNEASARGLGAALTMMQVARAVLCNGRGRYEDALAAAQEAATDPLELGPTKWALAELVEAGVRGGHTDLAVAAFGQLSAMTRASGTDLALGIEAGRCALLREDDAAEELYREAITRLGRTRMGVERARARLLYGEWLRRRGRRVDARVQLQSAYDALSAMGVEAFADRAWHELLATGETVRKRTVETYTELTAQEAHIARRAADGLTNPEIAAELYLSPRTVEWHLRKVFTKVGVTTRRQLRRSLPAPL